MSPRTSGLDFRTIFRRAASTFSQESPATTFKIRYASSSANWGIASGSGVTDFFGVVASVEVPLADSLEPGPGEDCPNPGKSSCCTGSVCKTDLGTGWLPLRRQRPLTPLTANGRRTRTGVGRYLGLGQLSALGRERPAPAPHPAHGSQTHLTRKPIAPKPCEPAVATEPSH